MAEVVDSLGFKRMMGNLTFATVPNFGWDVWGEGGQKTPLKTRPNWEAWGGTIEEHPLSPTEIKDQGSSQACNAFAICYAMEAVRRTEGQEEIELSPGYLYGCINNQFDNGSTLEGGAVWAQTVGTVPAEEIPAHAWREHLWPGTPQSRKTIARKYLVKEWWQCPTFDEMASAVQAGFPVVFGIAWGHQDNVTPANEWLANDPAGGLAGGHAMCAIALAKKGGKWGLLTVNSWGDDWGNNGWLVVPEQRFKSNFGGGAWALRSMAISDPNFVADDDEEEEEDNT